MVFYFWSRNNSIILKKTKSLIFDMVIIKRINAISSNIHFFLLIMPKGRILFYSKTTGWSSLQVMSVQHLHYAIKTIKSHRRNVLTR